MQNRNPERKQDSSGSRFYQLQFLLPAIPSVVYTGENIVVQGTRLEIALFDAATGDLVEYGPEASAKVEIVVVNGDFDPNGGIRTSYQDQFNDHIVGGEGRNSMLRNDVYLNLQGGIGFISEISFKHKAQHTIISKLRLGARVVDLPDSIEVRAAVTRSFIVKDKRLKSKKRDPPSPTDEVWRLEMIGRNGSFHKKLTAYDIRTVEDFLSEFSKNPARLRGILGPTMSNHMWNATLSHAQRCKRDGEISLSSIESSLEKFVEYISSDAIIIEDSQQTPYASYQQTTPHYPLQNCLQDDDISGCINELLLYEEPGESCILHSNENKDHIMNSSSAKVPLNSRSCQQVEMIPGNDCCAYLREESCVNDFKGNGKGKKRWTVLLIILKLLIRRIVKFEHRTAKKQRMS